MEAPLGNQESTGAMRDVKSREANYTHEITPWNEALKDVQKLKSKGFEFGPGAKGRQEFQSFIQSLTPETAAKYGVDKEKLRLFADAAKYLTQATNERAARGLLRRYAARLSVISGTRMSTSTKCRSRTR